MVSSETGDRPANIVDLYHAGDLGDVVYAVPALRRLANPAHLTLYPNPGTTRALMDEHNASMIIPLLNAQNGITADWKPTFGSEGLRMDFGVRRFYRNGYNLADIHSNWVGHDHWHTELPWLIADFASSHPYKIVVARSARYRNPKFDWRALHAQFHGRACFVGVPWEHQNFQEEVGPIDYVETPSLLDVARLIMGADMFIGNQSCPRAIAEGLKVPVVVEQGNPGNTHFSRECAWYPNNVEDFAPLIEENKLAEYWCRAAARRAIDRSMYPPEHLETLAMLCRRARRVSGVAAEVGVGNGGSAAVLAWCLQRQIHLCDDYSKLSPEERENTVRNLRLFIRVYNYRWHPGVFPSSIPLTEKFNFVHIDTGTMQSLSRVVEWFVPKMSEGGIIAFSGFPMKSLQIAIPRVPLKHIEETTVAYYTK